MLVVISFLSQADAMEINRFRRRTPIDFTSKCNYHRQSGQTFLTSCIGEQYWLNLSIVRLVIHTRTHGYGKVICPALGLNSGSSWIWFKSFKCKLAKLVICHSFTLLMPLSTIILSPEGQSVFNRMITNWHYDWPCEWPFTSKGERIRVKLCQAGPLAVSSIRAFR